MIRRILKWVGLALAAAVLVLLGLALWPTSTSGLGSEPEPVASYQAAVTAFDAVRAGDRRESAIPVCYSRLLTHGRKTERAMVLVHGLTNCPAQFLELGREMYAEGWNVLILRLPHHGIGDPKAGTIGSIGNLGKLTAGELARYGDRAIDIAQGLGDEVQVMGLSAGGVVAAWAAQERDDVQRAIVIAPAIAIKGMPYAATWVLTNLFDRVPNVGLDDPGAVSHTYDGWSTRGLSETFTLGKRVKKNASVTRPDAPSIVFVLNPNDDDISNDVAREVVGDWKREGGNVFVYELPPRPVLEHDIIDPSQPWARPGFVYPRLIRLADAPVP